MNRLPSFRFDRIRFQRHVQTHGQVQPRSLSQSLTVGSILLKLALWAGISLTAGFASAVYAYTTQDLLTVYRETGENYNALTRRAEDAARSLAQQRFDSDILQTRVIITVVGDNGGQVAPILVLDVKREDWRSRPDPQIWAKYYRSTPLLLEMDGNAPVRPTQPVTPVVPQTTPSPAAPTAPTAPATPANPSPTPNSPADRRTTTLRSAPNSASSSSSNTSSSPAGTGVNPSPINLPLPTGETGTP